MKHTPGSTPDVVQRLRLTLKEIEQLRNDVVYWNAKRLDQEPIDLGTYLVAIGYCKAAIAHGEANDRPNMELEFGKLFEIMKGWEK